MPETAGDAAYLLDLIKRLTRVYMHYEQWIGATYCMHCGRVNRANRGNLHGDSCPIPEALRLLGGTVSDSEDHHTHHNTGDPTDEEAH